MSDKIHLVAKPVPLLDVQVDSHPPAGKTIAEYIDRSGIDRKNFDVGVCVNGVPIIEVEEWELVRLEANDSLSLAAVPQGGGGDGKSVFGLIAGIFVAIAAPYAAGFLAPILGITSSIGTGLLTAGIGLIGKFAISAIAPSPTSSLRALSAPSAGALGTNSPSYSVSGIRNSLRPYEVVPKIYGMIKVYPPMAVAPYTRSKANEQYLSMVFGVYSGLSISEIKIGDTPLLDYDGVEYEWVDNGGSAFPQSSIFSRVRHEDVFSVSLNPERPTDNPMTYGPGSWFQKTSAEGTRRIYLEFIALGGIAEILEEKTVATSRRVTVEIQFREVGDSDWLRLDGASAYPEFSGDGVATGFGSFSYLNGIPVFTTASTSSNDPSITFVGNDFGKVLRKYVTVDLPDVGQYEVRCRMLQSFGAANALSINDEVVWSGIDSRTLDRPIYMDNMAALFVDIKASGQLNGVVDQLNFIAKGECIDWDGNNWVAARFTANPASIFRDILQGNAAGTVVADEFIDLVALQEWHEYCSTEGWKFNAIIDTAFSTSELLRQVCSVGRATPTIKDGKFSVVIDKPQSLPVQWITGLNSHGYSGRMTYPDLPHAFKVRYNDKDSSYVQVEQIVYDDGYNGNNATKFEVLDLFGVVDGDIAFRMARYLMAVGRLRPEEHEVTMDIEHLVATRGDLVRFAQDVISVGVSRARIKSFTTDGGGDTNTITFDREVTMEADTDYSIAVRKSDQTEVVATLTLSVGSSATVTCDPVIPSATAPAVGDLTLFGVAGTVSRDCIITGLQMQNDLSSIVTMVDYNEAIYASDDEPIPNFDPGITITPIFNPPTPPKPVIVQIVSDESVAVVSSGTVRPAIEISLDPPAGTNFFDASSLVLSVQYRISDANANYTQIINQSQQPNTVKILDVQSGVDYDIRLTYLSDQLPGVSSLRTEVKEYTVVGNSTPPKDVTDFYVNGSLLTWSYSNPPVDVTFGSGFRVKYNDGVNANWAAATSLHQDTITVQPFDIGNIGFGNKTILIKAVDSENNESTNPAVIYLNLGDITTENIVLTDDIAAAGFVNNVNGGHIDFATGGDRIAYAPHALLNILAGELDLRTHAAAADWTTASHQFLGGKMVAAGNQQSYGMSILNGYLVALYSTNGAAVAAVTSTELLPFINGTAHWVRITCTTEWGEFKFWTSDDGLAWTQLGDAVTEGPMAFYAAAAPYSIGASNNGAGWLFEGSVFRNELRTTINSTLPVQVFEADDSTAGDATWTSAETGELWTLAGFATAANSIAQGGSLSGGDLVANADASAAFWTDDNEGFWTDDNDVFWDTTYSRMTYEFDFAVSPDLLDAVMYLSHTITGKNLKISYRPDSYASFWSGNDSGEFWTDDDDPFWTGALPVYAPWPETLAPLRQHTYHFKIELSAGATQGVIDQLSVNLDVPDIIQTVQDQAIAAIGTVIQLSGTWRAIKDIGYNIQGGDALVVKFIKDAANAQITATPYDNDGNATTATIDVTPRGY